MRWTTWAVPAALALSAGCQLKGIPQSDGQVRAAHDNRKERATALNVEGLRLAREGRMVQAEAVFRKALEVNSSCAAAHNNLGLIHVQRKRWYEAAMCFTRASKLDPLSSAPHMNLSALYARVGWHEEQEREWEVAQALEAERSTIQRSAQVPRQFAE